MIDEQEMAHVRLLEESAMAGLQGLCVNRWPGIEVVLSTGDSMGHRVIQCDVRLWVNSRVP